MPNPMMKEMGAALMDRERVLEMERAREAELVQRRMAAEAQQIQAMPQGLPQQQPSISHYIAQMKTQNPASLPPVQQPKQAAAQVPGIQSLIQALMSRASPDPKIDARLATQAGGMFMNNQRHLQKLDDFERERARASMMQPRLR